MTNLEKLKEIEKIQSQPGNFDHDPYMHGMANGIILAVAIMENRDPNYLDAPKEWGKDRPTPAAVPTEAQQPGVPLN